MDGIFQVIRAFDDAEVIHVEGDVNPLRDMEIIQTELRLKDIEWVEKHLEGLKKSSRALGSNSLADKAKKEEIATVEKILNVLTVQSKDVRKAEWSNKEVCGPSPLPFCVMNKSSLLDLTQLVEAGVTPHHAFEKCHHLIPFPPFLSPSHER